MKKNKIKKIVVLLLMFFLLASVSFARAGGAGRGRSRSKSSSRSSTRSRSTSRKSSTKINRPMTKLEIIIILFLIISIIIISNYIKKSKNKTKIVLNNLRKNDIESGKINSKINQNNGKFNFMKRNPDFKEQIFLNKVKQAFNEIQKAWEKQDLSNVRRYISDGVYQKFNVQFEMMKILNQINKIESLQILDIKIDKYEIDGNFDIIHVAIMADIIDKFISLKYPELNEGGEERFVEYWSFIRKKNTENFDLYSSKNCPKCGAKLPEKMGEISKCEYCDTFTNTGEYDWVLSEITQVDDYMAGNKLIKRENLKELSLKNPDFCSQHVEDKAGNGFLQILKSNALNTPNSVKRFISDDLYEKVNQMEKGIHYNRLYTNNVTLINSKEKENKNIIAVFIKYSQQRVKANGDYLTKIDTLINSENKIIIMERDKNNFIAKGQLYSNSCPNCGGPLGDTIEDNCPYCSSIIRNSKYEWIIIDILNVKEYLENFDENAKKDIEKEVEKDMKEIETGFTLEEIILNNVLVMLATDNNINFKEQQFAFELAEKYGFDKISLKALFEMAKHKRLTLRIPEDKEQKEQVFEYMKKAMKADNNITIEEEELLIEVRKLFFENK